MPIVSRRGEQMIHSPIRSLMPYARQAKKEGVEIFHFSSFDESWKVRIEGELGGRWGIWDKDEKLKYN